MSQDTTDTQDSNSEEASSWADEGSATEAPWADEEKSQEKEDSSISSTPEASKEAAPAKASPAKSPPKMIKVGDESVSEEDLIKNYSKRSAADAKFREAAEATKSVQAFMKKLQSDPMSVLSDSRINIDRRALAEQWLGADLENELKTDEQREHEDTQARLQEYETREETKKREEQEAQESEEYQKIVSSKKEEIQGILLAAMESSPLSQHPETSAATLREMAVFLRAAKESGTDVSPEEIANHVETRKYKEFYALTNHLQGDELVSFLGEDTVKKIRAFDLDRLRAKSGSSQKRSDSFEKKEEKESAQQYISPADAMDWD